MDVEAFFTLADRAAIHDLEVGKRLASSRAELAVVAEEFWRAAAASEAELSYLAMLRPRDGDQIKFDKEIEGILADTQGRLTAAVGTEFEDGASFIAGVFWTRFRTLSLTSPAGGHA